MRFITSIFILVGVVSAQTSTTYFVDAATGKDTNKGLTRAGAFRSLTFASSRLQDNDRLIVMAGTYSATKTGEKYPIQFGDTGKTTSQNNIKVIAESGPALTIVDGEKQMASAGVPIMRFRWRAHGASIQGFTFQNTGSASYWSMCFRLGSTSGANFACKDIEISGCVFRDVHRAAVIFGTDPNNANQTTGVKFHDNLIVNASHRPIAAWGDGKNFVFNNTFVGSTQAGIWVDSLFNQKSATLVANNIVVNSAVAGIEAGANGATATYLNNNAFNNKPNYKGFTAGQTNTAVDPKFVNATSGDYHLQSTSPMTETGTAAVPIVGRDLDKSSRLHDADKNNNAGIDKGAYEYHPVDMTMGGSWTIGGTGTFVFAGQTNVGAVLFSGGMGRLTLQPFGVLLLDQGTLASIVLQVRTPGTLSVKIPNNPGLMGGTFAAQGVVLSPPHLINAYTRTF